MNYLKTPILITAWNRPEKVRILINSLKVLKPENLYFSCDGPRNENINELEKTNQTRKIINENIDWDCNVKKNFNDTNLGCRVNMIKSINWVFESNEMAIILEDDCIPKPEFFKYCYLLLKKYEKDFVKEFDQLPESEKELVLSKSKVASQVLATYNKSI